MCWWGLSSNMLLPGGGFLTRSTAAIAAAAARASSGSCAVPVLVVFVGDAVIDPAIALAAAREVDDPGGFKQRSIAALVAAVAIANSGSSDTVLAAGVVGVFGSSMGTGDAAPNPSATWALDCGAVDDVGVVV